MNFGHQQLEEFSERFLHIDKLHCPAIIIHFIAQPVHRLRGGQEVISIPCLVSFSSCCWQVPGQDPQDGFFTRDYKSYFPCLPLNWRMEKEEAVAVTELQKGDTYIVRNNELIPADSILIRGQARTITVL